MVYLYIAMYTVVRRSSRECDSSQSGTVLPAGTAFVRLSISYTLPTLLPASTALVDGVSTNHEGSSPSTTAVSSLSIYRLCCYCTYIIHCTRESNEGSWPTSKEPSSSQQRLWEQSLIYKTHPADSRLRRICLPNNASFTAYFWSYICY